MFSVLNTHSQYTFFYISKIITSYTFLLVFKIVESLQCKGKIGQCPLLNNYFIKLTKAGTGGVL